MIIKLVRANIFLTTVLLSTAAIANPALPAATPNTAAVSNSTSAAPQSIFSNMPSPAQPQIIPVVPNINANGFVLMDGLSGKILAAKNPDQRMEPASLTKMMTSYIVSMALREGRIHIDDLVPISEAAWRTGGSKMFVKLNDHIAVRDLMQGIIVDSGNDACVAMAEFVAGSQDSFVNLMNQEAQRLGMTGTHFMDVNGLPDPNHYTTPRDMAILARALIYDFPEDYKWYSQKWFAYNGIKQPNRNRLLWRDPSVDGVKTGHTDGAGFCLVASGQRNGTRLISVVMGAPTDAARADDSEQLLTYGFRFFETHKLYSANSALTNARVWSGINQQVPVGVLQDTYITIPPGQFNNLKANVTLSDPIKAPVQKGQTLGHLNITLNGKPVSNISLVALQNDPKGGLSRRMVDHVRLWF